MDAATQLKTLDARSNGAVSKVTFMEALRHAKLDILASNKTLDRAFAGIEGKAPLKAEFPFWTGTFIGYGKPGEKLGPWLVSSDDGVTFAFPTGDAKGEKNVALVAEHSDGYSLEPDGRGCFVLNARKVDVVESFPDSSGWHFADPVHGVPVGSEVPSDNPEARHLYRTGAMVGPVARSYSCNGENQSRNVYMYLQPSLKFGAALESFYEEGAKSGAVPNPAILGLGLTFFQSAAGELLVKGTPEQINAISLLLEQFGR